MYFQFDDFIVCGCLKGHAFLISFKMYSKFFPLDINIMKCV